MTGPIFPAKIDFDAPNNHVTFIRDVIQANAHAYKVTIAYKVVGAEKVAEDRDPAFLILAGLSFCHAQGPDTFSRFRGREEALLRLRGQAEVRLPLDIICVNTPISTRVYVDQPVKSAVYKALAKMDRAQMEKAHVPSRLVGFFKKLVKQPRVAPSPRKTVQSRASAVSRNAFTKAYLQARDEGKTREEAQVLGVAAARAAAVEVLR